ncbi:YebC/PmpR family DNA-binding transcriptional regulator [Patescibacteria group bacterium]
MSGHSKWSSIKHQKGIKDARKGKEFSKLANTITIAVREGGGSDPEANFKLRLAMDRARTANMPKDNIDRAIARANPSKDVSLQEITYEGFGPEGIAVLVKTLTNNKNRTVSEIRNVFNNSGGKMVTPGSVSHQFKQVGIIKAISENLDDLELLAIDLGANDTKQEDNKLIVYSTPQNLHKIQKSFKDHKVQIEDADFSYEPSNTIHIIEKSKAEKILKFVEILESAEEVVGVWSNFDIDDQIIKEIT